MMKTYEKYKPSSIEWLGDIPEHWNTKRLKFASDVILGKMLTNDDGGDYLLKPYLRAANIQWMNVDVSSIKEMWFSPTELAKLRVIEGDLLVSEGGEVGRTCIWQNELDECYIQNSVHKISFFGDFNPKFFLYQFYFLGSIGFFESIVNRISIAHLTGEKIKETQIWFPLIPEQIAIAKYLDEKTAQLDKLIEGKRRLIALLKEERDAVINKAVTRGLNLRAKLKPSGFDWLGEIPEHWEVKRLKFISPKISVGLVINPSTYFDENGTIPMLTGKNVSPGSINASSANLITEESNELLYKTRLQEDDIIVVRVGYPGVAAVVRKHIAGANCASMVIVRKGEFSSDFLSYCFNSDVGKAQVEMVEYGAAQKQFNISHIIDFLFPLPPIDEQKQIVQFIDTETDKIDATVAKIEKEIEYLLEYRTALISEVVTGKIKVV